MWFSFTMKLLIGAGKVFNYFGGGYLPRYLTLEASREEASSMYKSNMSVYLSVAKDSVIAEPL